MESPNLAQTIETFAAATCALPEHILASGGWAWDDYQDVRYAHLHTTMVVRALAGVLLEERYREGQPLTAAQNALLEHQIAFRDMEAQLVGLPDSLLDTPPAPGEWPLRTILQHVYEVERYFFATILNALDGGEARELEPAEIAARVGEAVELPNGDTIVSLWGSFQRLHWSVQQALWSLNEAEWQTLSTMWEAKPLPVLFRMQRFGAHLREHSIQVEKSLRQLGHVPGEAMLLIRQMYGALGQVEGLRIGQGPMGSALCATLAAELEMRYATIFVALRQVGRFLAALQENDVETVCTLLSENQGLAATPLPTGESPLLHAHYRGWQAMTAALREAGYRTNPHEAAALGDTERLRLWHKYEAPALHAFARDGYTPLQLAAFFGHADTVRFLLEVGADVQAVARNEMRIQPLHAAVAARNAEIVRDLLAAGADVHARQQENVTPLAAAQQNGDAEIEALLRAAGATA